MILSFSESKVDGGSLALCSLAADGGTGIVHQYNWCFAKQEKG